MAVYHTWQRLSIRTNNRHIMTTLKNISPTVYNLQNVSSPLVEGIQSFGITTSSAKEIIIS